MTKEIKLSFDNCSKKIPPVWGYTAFLVSDQSDFLTHVRVGDWEQTGPNSLRLQDGAVNIYELELGDRAHVIASGPMEEAVTCSVNKAYPRLGTLIEDIPIPIVTSDPTVKKEIPIFEGRR